VGINGTNQASSATSMAGTSVLALARILAETDAVHTHVQERVRVLHVWGSSRDN